MKMLAQLRTLLCSTMGLLIHCAGAASGYAQGQGNAYAQGSTVEGAKKEKAREIGQSAHQSKSIKGSKTVDHLGIEG